MHEAGMHRGEMGVMTMQATGHVPHPRDAACKRCSFEGAGITAIWVLFVLLLAAAVAIGLAVKL